MPPFIIAQLLLGTVILTIAALHLAMAWKGVRPTLNLLFALMGGLVAVEAFAAPVRYLSPTPAGAVLGGKIAMGAILAYAATLVWFAREFTGARSKAWPLATTVVVVIALGFHLLLPFSAMFRELPVMREAPLIGGGSMYVPVAPRHPSLYLGNLSGFLCIAYLVWSVIFLWRQPSRRREAITLSLGLGPLVLFAYPHGVLVNRGVLDPPHFYSLAFLGLVVIVSENILSDMAGVLSLTRTLQAQESRWRTLLDNVSLMVLQCNHEGRIEYVNPYLLSKTGQTASALKGKPFEVLFPESELAHLREVFQSGMAGQVSDLMQTGLKTRSGRARQVYWSSVLLRGPENQMMGVLSVGADITDRVQAEADRDAAIAALAELKRQLEAENEYLRLEQAEVTGRMDIIGESDSMRYVRHKIAQVAGTEATVLIEGETGVGKELVARAIHNMSLRAAMPFVRVNCAALPAPLVESELFGHERGAFTGADRARQGRFELAEGGTILLDEIGELPLEIQSKLLRVLQEGEYDRVGGSKTRKTNVRVIASTNRHLPADVASGRFREDLYYRLQVFPITVPPLRERREDIPALVQHFVRTLATKNGRPVPDIPMAVIRLLSSFAWPGNVRELQNVLERAIITSNRGSLSLPADFSQERKSANEAGGHGEVATLDEVERRHIEEVLRRTQGQIAGEGGAAEILGLHPNTLRGRMSKLGVRRPNGSPGSAGL